MKSKRNKRHPRSAKRDIYAKPTASREPKVTGAKRKGKRRSCGNCKHKRHPRSAKRDIYAKPTASRKAAQLWGRCMSVLKYGSAKRDLFILISADSV